MQYEIDRTSSVWKNRGTHENEATSHLPCPRSEYGGDPAQACGHGDGAPPYSSGPVEEGLTLNDGYASTACSLRFLKSTGTSLLTPASCIVTP